MMANVYLVDARGEHSDSAAGTPTPAHSMRGMAAESRSAARNSKRNAGNTTGSFRRRPSPAIRDDGLMVFPVRDFEARGDSAGRAGSAVSASGGPAARRAACAPFGFTVIELNLDYIVKEMLPELTQRHFAHTTGDAYRVSVTTAETPPKVIYQSELDAPMEPARADATESLYGRDPLGFFRGSAAVTTHA